MERTSECDTTKEILSLKDTCLEFIARNLSIYNTAFRTTEDADLKGNLEYLRRFHSLYLIEKNLLNKSNFNLLINEYLEEFNISYIRDDDWDAVLKRVVEVGHAFPHVAIYNYLFFRLEFEKCMDFVHGVVRNIPNVERLVIHRHCNDTTLEIIASSCPKLKELVIKGSDVTKEGLKSLCRPTGEKGPSLRAVSLSGGHNNLNDGVEFLLRNMPSLEDVELSNLTDVLYRMHKDDKDISHIKYNLLSLYFGYDRLDNITDALAVITEVCPRVRRLTLPKADAKCLDLITRFSELEDLDITGGSLHADCSSFLKCRGGGLRKLKMHELQFSADTLIQSCPKLEILLLNNMTFRPLRHGSFLTSLHCLRELSLYCQNFEETLTRQSVASVLKSSPNLGELSFLFCKFENPRRDVTDLIGSCASSSLLSLEFFSCPIEEATLRTALSTCLDLKKTRLEIGK